MKKSYKVGIIIVAFTLVAGIAVFAVENQPAKSGLIHLKTGGETVAELRLLKGDTLSLIGGSQMMMTNPQRIVAKNATMRFGDSPDEGFTVKADEAEIFAGAAVPVFAVEKQAAAGTPKIGPAKLIHLISNGAKVAELNLPKGSTFEFTSAEQVQMPRQFRARGGVTIQIKRAGGSPVTIKADELVMEDAH